MQTSFSSIEAAISAIRAGQFVVVVDDAERENEGDLIIAAELVTPEAINFMLTVGRGMICMPATAAILERLELPLLEQRNQSPYVAPFALSFEAREGISTGVSAADRATSMRLAANPNTGPLDIMTPGHILPLQAKEQGVLARRGHTEACIDLVRLAGLQPAGALCEIINADGTMARLPDLIPLCQAHQVPLISIADLVDYREQHPNSDHEAA